MANPYSSFRVQRIKNHDAENPAYGKMSYRASTSCARLLSGRPAETVNPSILKLNILATE